MSIADRMNQTREVATKVNPQEQLKGALEKYKPQLSRALPSHMNVDRFVSVVTGAASKNPAIADCDPITIMQAVGQAARMGLEIDISGHGFLVPYNDNRNSRKVCQFIPGWQGIVDLINRSGRGVVKTGAVFHGDFFEYDLGLDANLRHRNDGAETADKLLYTYAIGYIKGEGGWTPPPILEVWKAEKVNMHFEQFNRVGKQHYALKDGNSWIQYARKLPLLQVCKYMPKSSEISKAIEAANKADSGEIFEGDFNFAPEAPPPSGSATPPPPPAQPAATYAQLHDRINAAKNRDAVDLILDEGRALPADQLKDLAALADKKFPRG